MKDNARPIDVRDARSSYISLITYGLEKELFYRDLGGMKPVDHIKERINAINPNNDEERELAREEVGLIERYATFLEKVVALSPESRSDLAERVYAVLGEYPEASYEKIVESLEHIVEFKPGERYSAQNLIAWGIDLEGSIKASIAHHYNNKFCAVMGQLGLLGKIEQKKGIMREGVQVKVAKYIKGLKDLISGEDGLLKYLGTVVGDEQESVVPGKVSEKADEIVTYMEKGQEIVDGAANSYEIIKMLGQEYEVLSKTLIRGAARMPSKSENRKKEGSFDRMKQPYLVLADLMTRATGILEQRYEALKEYLVDRSGAPGRCITSIEDSLKKIKEVNAWYKKQVMIGYFEFEQPNSDKTGLFNWCPK